MKKMSAAQARERSAVLPPLEPKHPQAALSAARVSPFALKCKCVCAVARFLVLIFYHVTQLQDLI